MQRSVATPAPTLTQVQAAVKMLGATAAAAKCGLTVPTIRKAMAGGPVAPDTLIKLGRLVGVVREASDFKGKTAVASQRRNQPSTSWTLEALREARDAQLRGDFKRPVRLAETIRTDDALFCAYHNRIAPHVAIKAVLESCGGVRGDAICKKAGLGVHAARSTLEGILGTMVNHGIAIGYLEHEPSDDGSRVDFRLTEWPLEHVKWNASREVLETSTRDGLRVDIVHGDSRWVVFRKFQVLPWTQEACLLPASFVWAAHAEGLANWAGSAKSHGQSKIVGSLPEGVSLQADDTGALTPQAEGLLNMLTDLVTGEAGAGVHEFASKVDFISDGSSAWQVFSELIQNREKAAARIYQGTDAAMGSVGGAPGVDIAQLFGVATTKVQGDFQAIEQALATGVYQPWTAINEGDSRYAPRLAYQMPDVDSKSKRSEEKEKLDQLFDALEQYKATGMTIDQAVVNALAARFGITKDIPQLAAGDTKAVPIELAPTDVAKIVRVGPALRSLGLEPFGDERDGMTITELDEANKAKAAAAQAAAQANADANAQIKVDEAAPVDPRPAALNKFAITLSKILGGGRFQLNGERSRPSAS